MISDEAKRKELVRMWRHFSILTSSGVPTAELVRMQRSQAESKELGVVLSGVARYVEGGASFDAALACFPDWFPPSVVAMVKAGLAGNVLDVIAERIAKGLESGAFEVEAASGEPAQPMPEPVDAAKLLDDLIHEAESARASDIHLEPTPSGGQVRLRVDGVLTPPKPLDRETYLAMINRMRILAKMDIGEGRRPQDGRILFPHEGRELDLRVSLVFFIGGPSIVARILDRSAVKFELRDLGCSPETLAAFQEWSHRGFGMHFISGPTGSGKTTAYYAILSLMVGTGRKVMSAENPVEYVLDGVQQAETQERIGVTFPALVRSFLRQDPDVILLGELRDREAANVMVQASLTGHLLLSTIHTENATEVPVRLIDMGLDAYLVGEALKGAAAMRLVRKVCPKCRQPHKPESLDALKGLPDERELAKAAFLRGKGCGECLGTGYRGRTALYEIMPFTPAIVALIRKNASADELRRAAIAAGMISLRHDGARKAAQGITTLEEVVRATVGSD